MNIKPWIGHALLAASFTLAAACGGGGDTGAGGSNPSTGGSGGDGGATSSSSSSSSSGMVTCGNGALDTGEKCDGKNLDGKDCVTEGFGSGTLACNADCTFDTSACDACGNAMIDGAEQCDGANLDGKDCVTEGFGSGTLACNADCTFDTTACDPCGNAMIDGVEECDGANLNSTDCVSLGFGSGTLTCTANCTLDSSQCDPCGNATIDGAEECDGADFGAATCVTLGFDAGTLGCDATCKITTGSCIKEDCTNGVDDTADGMIDCADPFCAAKCQDPCLAPPALADPSVSIAGNTTGHADLTDDTCFVGGGGAGEVVYSFTPSQTGVCDLLLVSPGVDLGLSARTTCASNASELACKDDAYPGNVGDPDTEEISVPCTAGTPIFIHIEGYSNAAGAYTVSAASRPIVCGDLIKDPGEVCDGAALGGETCATQGYAGGNLACSAQCVYNPAGCTGCAHNKCTAGGKLGAACDPCVMQVCATDPTCCNTAWTAACAGMVNAICGAGTCAVCGDGVVSAPEVCDGANLNNKTCVTQGYSGGQLSCNAGCAAFNTSLCTPFGEIEQNGTFGTANQYQGVTSAQITMPVGGVKDFDFFKIAAGAGQTITATVGDIGNGACLGLTLDSDVAILGTNGVTQLAFNDDINPATNYCSSTSTVVGAAGTYFVRVRSSQAFDPNGFFPYILTITVQ